VLSTGVVPQWFARPFAVGGLVFFIDALVYFAYRFVGPFAVERAGGVDVRIIVFDVMLFSVFALHHSLFARDTIRKRITGLVGSLERSVYVWIASALFVAVCALWRPLAGATWRIDQPAAVWTLRAAQLAGVWLAVHSALMIDLFELAGLREAQATEFKPAGPYGWVRHPIYLGWFLMVFPVPHMTMTQFVFAVTSSVYLLIAIPFEERSLRHSTSGAYDRYMREVRWKLLPHVY
jgi:protein-S-isoprenylcysteine O-methyltransferase Ste14